MMDILKRLSAHFSPDIVSWRVGATNQDKSKGMALAYLDSRDIQDRFNEVCGLNWQVRHPWASGTKLACEIGIKIGDEWIWRGDGAGDSDVEAEKGAFSDSFKRAAVRWGVGRYLYDIDSPWVAIESYGRSYSIAKHELGKLRDLLYRVGRIAQPKPEEGTPFDDELDAREQACNRLIAQLRSCKTEDSLIALWKSSQGEILAMTSDQIAAVTKAKDEAKAKLPKRAA